jgi:MFS family permease
VQSPSLERNLKLIPFHEALSSSMVYLPVFVLFTRDNFGVSGALQLASLTYLFIVLLEVPSGWMSDWLGRVPTLSVAASGFVIGQACFLFGGTEFGVIVLGQFFVSAGYAFISGTDVSFHFDSLEGLGLADEYAQRQARISSLSYLVRTVSALVGGVLGLIDLRLTFAVSLVIALGQLAVTRLLYEPGQDDVKAERFMNQIGKCVGYLRRGFMAWLFFYGIALVVLEHVAFTLMQPWLTEALGQSPDELGATPLVSGGLFAVTALVGAFAARASAPAQERFGTVATLIGLGVVSAVIVTGMALSFSILILGLMAFRSVQSAAAPVLISAAVAPRTEQQHRATLLSINSLAGRLFYGGLLQLLAIDAEDDPGSFLQVTSIISWILVALLLATGTWAAAREESHPPTPIAR